MKPTLLIRHAANISNFFEVFLLKFLLLELCRYWILCGRRAQSLQMLAPNELNIQPKLGKACLKRAALIEEKLSAVPAHVFE